METLVNSTKQKTTKDLIIESLPKAITYRDYREMVGQLATQNKSTGPNQTEALSNYTLLNDKRMKRWDKTFKITEEQKAKIEKQDSKVLWMVLTESWCGDAAPSMPVMNKMAEINPNINLKVLLRDDNLELMNRFLTNGAMSIPRLISLDEETGEVIGNWGPRSTKATEMVETYKKEHGTLTPEFKQDLQLWYNTDKGQNIMEDLLHLLPLK